MDKTKLKGVAALIAAAVAVILAAFLCMSFPMAEVHAAEYDVSDGPSLVCRMAEAQEGDIIRLQDSITIDLTDEATVQSMYGGRVEANKDLYLSADTTYPAHSQTLDLNGKTLTIITGSDKSCFTLEGAITLTITDSSAEGTGAIVGYSNGSLFYSETQASSLVLQDVAVKFTEYTEGGASITPTGAVIDTVGNVTLNNVTYTPAEGDPALIEDNAGAQVSYVADKAEELAAAVADSSYSTVMLGADITQNITVEAGRTLTLDLNGHTINIQSVEGYSSTAPLVAVDNYGTLTLRDSAGSGGIYVDTTQTSSSGRYVYAVRNNAEATATVESGTYNSADKYAVYNAGKLTVKDGIVSSLDADGARVSYALYNADGGEVTIENGSFTGTYAVYNRGGSLKIENGNFKGNYGIYSTATDSESPITITGGTFTATQYGIQTVTGSSLSVHNATINVVGTSTVHGLFHGGSSAEIVDTIINVETTGTIAYAFETNHASTESITISGESTLSAKSSVETSSYAVYFIGSGRSLTIADNVQVNSGIVRLFGSTNTAITGGTFTDVSFTAASTATVTVTAGTFISDDVQNMGFNSSWLVSGGQSYALYSTDTQNRYTVGVYDPERAEDVVFVGGIVAAIGDETYSDIAAAVEAAGDNDTIKLLTSVNGLTVIAGKNITLDLNGFNVTAAAAGEYAVTVESGALLIIVGDGDVCGYNGESGYSYRNNGTLELRGGTYTQILDFAVVGDDCSVAITDNGAFTVSEEAAVATITRDAITYNFANVQSAFRFAQNNDTIVLQQDASAGGIQFNVGEDETIVFDLNGHDVSANSVFFNMLSGTLSIVNGDTQGSTMTTKQRAFQIMPNIGCTATLQLGENITVRAGGDNAVFMQTNYDSDYVKTNGTENLPLESVLISSADIIATNGVAIQGNGTMHGTRIVINGCSVVSETSHAIYHPQYGELIIENADVKGWVTGVEIRAGVLEVRNSTIIGSGSFSAEANGDGTTVSGAAVAVSQHTTDLPVSVTIEEGSVLRGEKALYEEDLQNSTVTDIELSVTGGSFEGEVYSQNVSAFIAGGSFDTDLTDTYLTEGYVQDDESGEIITEEEANAVAMIETADGIVYYDTLQEAIDACGTNEATVTLLKNLTESVSIAEGQEIVLDLNGCTLTNSGTNTIVNNGTLTVTGNGKVDNTVHQGAALQNNGKATLENGTFTRSKEAGKDDNANGNSWYVIDNSGTLTLKDVTVYQGTDEVNALQWTFSSTIRNKGASAEQMAVMEVDGATVVSGRIALKNDDWGKMTIADAEVTGGNQAVQNWAQLEINGGTFAGDVATWFYAIQGSEPETRTHATITGGAFNGGVVCFDYDQDEGKVEIDQGVTISGTASFSEMPKYTYFADDYIAAWDEDSEMYVTAQGDWAAVINDETAYATLGEALAAAKDGDTVMLLNDIELASGSAVKAPSLGIALTIDLNGHTITSADGYSAVFDITTTKSFTLTSSKEGAAIEAAYALRLRGSGTGEVAIAVENIAFSGAYVFNSPLTFGRSNTTQVSVTLRNVHAAYTDNLKNMQSFLLNADRLASLQVTGSTITVSSTNAEKAQGAYAVNLIATEAAFTDSTIAATGTLARGIYSHNFGTVISALTLNNTAVTAEDIAIESSYADLTVNGGTVTSNASAAVLFFGHMTPESAAAAIDTQEGYQTLTVTGGAQISGYTFGIGGNAAGTYDGTVMNIEDAVITGGEEAPGVFQPHVGILNIGGENTKITGSSGVVVRAGRLNITGGTFIATYATLNTVEGSGSVIDGAAVAVSHHSSNQPLTVSITGGTFNGVYSVYEDTLLSGPDPAKVSVSLAGGVYNGGVYSENKAGFITGGSFKQQPAEELFDENYAAEYQNGYYVAVRSDALKTARANAQADVRGYAAANGISWLALAEEAATVGTETPVYTAQQAADILAAFNKIDSAMTQLAVAEARLAAMNMVDAYVEALDTYKLDMIGDLQTAAADDEETVDVDESVVLPTATYSAIYNATSASEIDFYVANALAEIEAIRSLRTEISGQTQQLADLADALEAMSDGLFGDTESGTQGAFAELLGDVQGAIKQAQNAIVNGTTGEDGATTSTSLASIQNYLAEKIKTTLDSINTALNDTTNGLKAIKDAITDLDVSDQLEDGFGNVLTAITNAQNAIMGATGENAGKSIADAISEINETTASAVKGLRNELVGEDGKGGMLGTIVGYVDGLKDMLGDKDSGLAAIVANIKAAQAAIMGTASSEDAAATGLQAVLEAVNTADGVIDQVLAAVQGLTDENGILTQIKSAVDELTGLNIGGEFDDVRGAITAAQNAIMGATEESAGTSIAGAVTAITDVVNALTKEGGMVYAINETLNGLSEALTSKESNAFTKLAEELKLAIIGTGDATLTEIASGVADANSAIQSVLTAVKALTDANDGIVAQVETALADMLKEIKTLTGALATSEQVKGIETGIADAKTEIDKIVAAIGSLGTGEGNDLAAQIGSVVDSLESVQGAVDEIGSNLGVAVDIEETKTNAVADLEVWLNAYLDTLLGTTTDEAESGVVMLAVTLETEDGDLYGRLTQAYSEANAQLILKYYNQALTAIDNATSTTDVSTAVSTFRAQVASVDAAAQNTPSMTGVYVLLAIVLVVLIAASIVVILKNRKAAVAVAAEPAAEAAAEEKPAEEAKPEAAEEAAEEGSETEESAEAEKPEAEEELAADDDDKEQVVIAANVRSFAEAYVELSDEQRELFNKVKEYALGKEGTSEVKLSSGDCVKLGSKQVVKLAVRRGNPVALFVLENEMLKDFRRGATTQAKLKVRATELVLREEADLETAYTMVDLSIDQIKKDAEAAKERRREQRRERRKQRLAEEAARQAEHDGSED